MNGSRKRGFTLVEIVVAAMILSAASITIGAICNKCIRSVKVSKEYEIAWNVLDKQLSTIDYVGLSTYIESDRMAGQIEEDETVYNWQMQVTDHDILGLYKVDMVISWEIAKKPHSVSASTMFFTKKAQE